MRILRLQMNFDVQRLAMQIKDLPSAKFKNLQNNTLFSNNLKYGYSRYMDEQFLSIAEVATMLNISRDTVRRMFASEPGVINVGPARGASRRYRVLRIPLGVLKRVMSAREVNQAEQLGRTEQ
jgi:AraC-like DNA-binding protein